jgi:hypothetical protein
VSCAAGLHSSSSSYAQGSSRRRKPAVHLPVRWRLLLASYMLVLRQLHLALLHTSQVQACLPC